ncbi:feruloyl-CoA synthase [Marinobacterium lutimaris]|uniref:4-coumarate--CoA ligase n=1 Tax=Marinobacterium lutimaris TaxID=568106 RepID=A0A1H5T851_9GAMM|nr:feruloyl-CoA synthase [Marinobacterium lutimaris]SEF58934.1 4-coumarate--CoA ligase [Marinobacterium lutimaris]
MLADFHPVNVHDFGVEVEYRDNGEQVVRCPRPLDDYAVRITDRLEYWADKTPDAIFVAQRNEEGEWEKLTYRETLERVTSIAAWLLDKNLSAERPVMCLSGNSIEHLLLALGSQYIGVPYSPISTAYSLISTDYGKLRHVFDLLTPGLVFVDNLGPFRDAIDAVIPADLPLVAVSKEHGDDGLKNPVTLFSELLDTPACAAADAARDATNGDTIAKFMFTSGSTGMPKAVINTQRMICANQVMMNSLMEFLQEEPPVLVDWLPWNHTFGGNHNIGIALYNGGSLYIDHGKPTHKAFGVTLKNLTDVAPTVYFNVPKGYELLVKELRAHPEVAKKFFSRLQLMHFAAAGLSQHIWDAIDELAIEHTGKKVPMITGLGATETAPAALFASIVECASGVIGTPLPGIELKLVPNGDKMEARVRGSSVTPGYWRAEEQTAKAFDEEGFYCLGDAVKYIDPEKPGRGFRFDGRVSEDFKLDTGTWVSVGTLRAHIIHFFAPYIQDVVIAGHDRDYVSAMVFADIGHCRKLIHDGDQLSDLEVLRSPRVRETFQRLLNEMAETATGSSTCIRRLRFLEEAPSIDLNEVTDKGSINQRAVLKNRDALVKDLYSEQPSDEVMILSR